MRINTNIASLNAQKNLGATGAAAAKTIGRLSSGFRINSASDDAAGLGIANNLRSDVRALQQASRNSAQALSMLQTADGAAQTIGNILDRAKELAAQSASDNIGSERGKLETEFAALKEEIGRILDTTRYQGTNVLTSLSASKSAVAGGAATAGNGIDLVSAAQHAVDQVYTITVTENADPTQATITLAGADGSSETLRLNDGDGKQALEFRGLGITVQMNSNFDATAAGGLDTGTITVASTGAAKTILVGASRDYAGNDSISLDVGTLEDVRSLLSGENLNSLAGAQQALDQIDSAIGHTNDFLGKIGATMNRIEFARINNETMLQNTQAAESTIRDADMAAEMSTFTKQQILQQAGVAMLAQANSAPQQILRLLQ